MQRPAASKRTKERPKRKPGPQLSVGKDVPGVKPGERVSLCGKYIRGVDGKTRPVSSGSRAKPPTTKAPKSSQPPSRAGPPQITAPRPKLYGDALLKQKIHWEREKLFSRGKQLFEKAGMAVEVPSQAPTRQVQTLQASSSSRFAPPAGLVPIDVDGNAAAERRDQNRPASLEIVSGRSAAMSESSGGSNEPQRDALESFRHFAQSPQAQMAFAGYGDPAATPTGSLDMDDRDFSLSDEGQWRFSADSEERILRNVGQEEVVFAEPERGQPLPVRPKAQAPASTATSEAKKGDGGGTDMERLLDGFPTQVQDELARLGPGALLKWTREECIERCGTANGIRLFRRLESIQR